MTTWQFALIEKLYDTHRYFFDKGEYVKALIIAKFNLKLFDSIAGK